MPALLCPHRWILANPSCPRPRIPGVRALWRLEEQTDERGPAASRRRPGAALEPDRGANPPVGGRAVAGPAGVPGWRRWAGRGRADGSWRQVVAFRADDLGAASSRHPAGRGRAGCGGPPRPRPSCASPPPTNNSATRSPNRHPTATRTATTSLGWPPSPKPCPTTPWARSTRALTGRCCGRCAAAARPTSGGSRWGAGPSWPTPRAPSRSSCRAPTPGSGP